MRPLFILTLATLGSLWFSSASAAAGREGYYRHPALAGDTIIFVSEGDLWKVPVKGGTATRLTTHAGDEELPAVSPDGRTLAFTGQYEGPTEIYTMPLTGGTPERLTYGAGRITFVGWTPDGDILYASNQYAALPDPQLVRLHRSKISPDGKRILSGSQDTTMRLWDVDNGTEILKLEGHSNSVRGVALSPDGKRALSAGWDMTVRLWDVENGKEIRRFEGHTEDHVCSVAFSPLSPAGRSAGAA
jgi:WD40 repeat protein